MARTVCRNQSWAKGADTAETVASRWAHAIEFMDVTRTKYIQFNMKLWC